MPLGVRSGTGETRTRDLRHTKSDRYVLARVTLSKKYSLFAGILVEIRQKRVRCVLVCIAPVAVHLSGRWCDVGCLLHSPDLGAHDVEVVIVSSDRCLETVGDLCIYRAGHRDVLVRVA